MTVRSPMLLFLAFLTGCASFVQDQDGDIFLVNYTFFVFDQPDQLGYQLQIVSESINPICVNAKQWTLDNEMLYEGATTFITVPSGRIIHAEREAITGFVPGGRYHRIEPGETLNGFIPYALFGDPDEIRALPAKQLNHAIMPYLCR